MNKKYLTPFFGIACLAAAGYLDYQDNNEPEAQKTIVESTPELNKNPPTPESHMYPRFKIEVRGKDKNGDDSFVAVFKRSIPKYETDSMFGQRFMIYEDILDEKSLKERIKNLKKDGRDHSVSLKALKSLQEEKRKHIQNKKDSAPEKKLEQQEPAFKNIFPPTLTPKKHKRGQNDPLIIHI